MPLYDPFKYLLNLHQQKADIGVSHLHLSSSTWIKLAIIIFCQELQVYGTQKNMKEESHVKREGEKEQGQGGKRTSIDIPGWEGSEVGVLGGFLGTS